jgi:thiol:disulfide interchange protein DsbD
MLARAAALSALCLAAGTTPAAGQDPVRWSMAREKPGSAARPLEPGGAFGVRIDAAIDAGWHVYATTQTGAGPMPLLFAIPRGGPFAIDGPIDEPFPAREFDPNFQIDTLFHRDRAAFRVPVRVANGTDPKSHRLKVVVSFQTCNDRLCLPPKDVDLILDVAVGAMNATGAAVPAADAPSRSIRAPAPASSAAPDVTVAGRTIATAPSTTPRAPVRDLAVSADATTFGAYLWLAAAMGALSLLTPCVFPMIPITISYFTGSIATTGHGAGTATSRHGSDAVRQALLYGVGIVLTFTAVGFTLAAAFGAAGLNRFAADPWLNLGVTALFVAFALSLFGVYELALPARLLTLASRADQGGGRFAGPLLMGLAFTLTSFTCTAPFLGTLLVVATQGRWQWPLAGMFAFAAVFALPFVVLALAPRLVAALPKSGSWLIAVKAAMGMLELAAAMKFLSNADLVWGWGIFTREVVIASWIAIALVLVVYLAGLMTLGRAPRLGRPHWARAGVTAAAAAFAIWLATGLLGRRLGELEAFLPPADLAAIAPDGELPWIVNDYDAALADAARQQRPLLIDFTGYTCTNCRWMEANMFPRPDVVRELARYSRVRLYTDGRGEPHRTFQQMEQTMFGTVALPYYAVLAPDGTPVVAFGGLTRDPSAFIAFLRTGIQ